MKGLWRKHLAWASESIGPSFIVLVNLAWFEAMSTRRSKQGLSYVLQRNSSWIWNKRRNLSAFLKWLLDNPQPRTSLKLARFYSDLKVQNISLKLWITWAPWARGIFLKCNFNVYILSSSPLLLLVIFGLKVDNLNLFKLHYSEYMHVFYSHICTLNSSSRREETEGGGTEEAT